MAYRFGEIEVTITSARDLKNVNWRHGSLRPYVVVWVDPARKLTTRVDEDGDTSPQWDQTLIIPFNAPPAESTLYIDVVHADAADDTKPLIGSARLPIVDVLDDPRVTRKLELLRPSGRPHGKIHLEADLRQGRYPAPDPYRSQPYGVRDYDPYATPYAATPAPAYGAAPPSGYQYGGAGYGQAPAYWQQAGYDYGQQPVDQQKKSKFGMGTGLAVGAVAGALGGLALAEGFDALEDHVADEATERVEELQYDDGDGGW